MHHSNFDFSTLFTLNGIISLITLSILEIILGIDNIIFISIAVNKLAQNSRKKARTIGLSLALLVRCILLLFVGWIVGLKNALFYIGNYGISGKGIILVAGGLFLLIKTWKEISEKMSGEDAENDLNKNNKNTFSAIILQIIIIDFVFSFDSILAAVGVSGDVFTMITAVVISMVLMILFSRVVADFINKNQGIKTIALTFLLLIGGIILAEGIIDAINFTKSESEKIELNKNYAYVALLFSLINEWFNMRERSNKRKKDLTLK
ncbi:MAG: TerC family protein [Bacteroidetes bacterium]|nr:TerC family protein [Bacteroidota bacterium]